MLNPMLHDGPGEVALMTGLQKKVLRSIYESSSEGLRSWQVQKKVDGTKLEVQEALHGLLAAGYIRDFVDGWRTQIPQGVLKTVHFKRTGCTRRQGALTPPRILSLCWVSATLTQFNALF